MTKRTITLLVLVFAVFASSLAAQDIKLSGAHYNLNIIGVEKAKTAPMQN